jgi:hypothetical protein
MASVFNKQHISYALEKLADYIHGSGSGATVPGWSDTASKVIIDSLRAFQDKLQEHNWSQDEREESVGIALYAACELQSFVNHDRSDIANSKAARVYRDFLGAKIEELCRLEQELDAS